MKITSRVLFLLIVLTTVATFATPAQTPSAQAPSTQVLDIDQIHVTGTRVPAAGVVQLSGLHVHDKVDERAVLAACHKITGSGLFQKVDYTYDAYPDRPGIQLNLAVTDEAPLVPASIAPASEEAAIWTGLAATNPIFLRSLPPTQKAIRATFIHKFVPIASRLSLTRPAALSIRHA